MKSLNNTACGTEVIPAASADAGRFELAIHSDARLTRTASAEGGAPDGNGRDDEPAAAGHGKAEIAAGWGVRGVGGAGRNAIQSRADAARSLPRFPPFAFPPRSVQPMGGWRGERPGRPPTGFGFSCGRRFRSARRRDLRGRPRSPDATLARKHGDLRRRRRTGCRIRGTATMSAATSSSKSPLRSRATTTRRSGGSGLLRAAFVRVTLPVVTLHAGPAGQRAG
jgi:hypothetical protein